MHRQLQKWSTSPAGLSEGPARRLGAEFQLGCAAALRGSRLLRALESAALFVGPEAEPGPAPGCSPRQPIGPGLVDRPLDSLPPRMLHVTELLHDDTQSCTCVTNDVDLLEGMPTGAEMKQNECKRGKENPECPHGMTKGFRFELQVVAFEVTCKARIAQSRTSRL
ncbi:hypothetical protein MRX96_012553 [Rhipicephalus microplus]